jgi:hypothetical protein
MTLVAYGPPRVQTLGLDLTMPLTRDMHHMHTYVRTGQCNEMQPHDYFHLPTNAHIVIDSTAQSDGLIYTPMGAARRCMHVFVYIFGCLILPSRMNGALRIREEVCPITHIACKHQLS